MLLLFGGEFLELEEDVNLIGILGWCLNMFFSGCNWSKHRSLHYGGLIETSLHSLHGEWHALHPSRVGGLSHFHEGEGGFRVNDFCLLC